jgi:hypothetical protein
VRSQDERIKKSFVIKNRPGYQGSPSIGGKMPSTLKEYPTVPVNSYGAATSKKSVENPVVVKQVESFDIPEPRHQKPCHQKPQARPELIPVKSDTTKRTMNIRRQSTAQKQQTATPAAQQSQTPAQSNSSHDDQKHIQRLMARKKELELLRFNLDKQISDENKANNDMSDVIVYNERS